MGPESLYGSKQSLIAHPALKVSPSGTHRAGAAWMYFVLLLPIARRGAGSAGTGVCTIESLDCTIEIIFVKGPVQILNLHLLKEIIVGRRAVFLPVFTLETGEDRSAL